MKKNYNLIQSLSYKIIEFSKDRYNTMGHVPSGLFDYYRQRTKDNSFFKDYEIFLLNYITENYSEQIKIHEIACGCGQILQVLSKLNYPCSGTELNVQRYNYAIDLNNNLDNSIIFYQENSHIHNLSNYDLVLSLNVAGDNGFNFVKDIEFFKKYLKQGCNFIIKIDTYSNTTLKTESLNKLREENISFIELEYNFIKLLGEK